MAFYSMSKSESNILEESLLNVLDVQQHYIHAYHIKYKNIIS